MEKKNSKLFIILGILILSFGVTFAYFVANTFTSGNGTSVVATTVNLNNSTLKVEGTLEFEDLDIYPGHTVVSAIKVTATGDNELIPYNLIWKGINEISALNYKVYRTSSSINVTSSCEKKTNTKNGIKEYFEECEITNLDQLGTEVETGRIIKNDTKAILVKDEFITATKQGQVVYYYVLLEYPNLDTSQNGDIDASFDGIVTVEESDKKPDINILAIKVEQEDGSYREETDIPTEGYKFVQSKSQCSNDAIPNYDNKNKVFYANNLTKSGTTCYLTFDILKPQTSDDIITAIRNSNSYKRDKTSGFGAVATGSETNANDANSGIFSAPDSMYKTTDNPNPVTYYWRGTGETNHVVFAGKCWRIIRINGNKSIRIIYNGIANGNSCADRNTDQKKNVLMADWNNNKGYPYATSDAQFNKSYYVGWTYGTGQRTLAGTDSYAKKLTEDWFNDNANFTTDQRDQVATGYFCNDRNVGQPVSSWNWGSDYSTGWSANGKRFAYAGARRLIELYSPTLECKDGDKYQLKVGTITADEVEFAGGMNVNNTSYYLYTSKDYLTMSPAIWESIAQVFVVSSSGSLSYNYVSRTFGLRPVINLKGDTLFTAGSNGTIDNPYVVME